MAKEETKNERTKELKNKEIIAEKESQKTQKEETITEKDEQKSTEKTEQTIEKPINDKKIGGEKSPKSAAKQAKKARGTKYAEARKLVDRTRFYTVDEAIELAKKATFTKFDESIELHIRLINKKSKDQSGLRVFAQLPNKVGKEANVAILDEALAEKILKDKKTDFDILIATPEMMPKLARLAKILGPQGKMPNPKAGTVTKDPQKAIAEIKGGKIEIKTDKQNILHQVIGKKSWEDKKIQDNFTAVLALIPQSRIASITICSSMGPGIKVKI